MRLPLRSRAKTQPSPAPTPRRSPLTAAMPRPATPGRVGRIVVRGTITAVIVGGLVTLVHAIRSKSLGDGPFALAFYQAHDSIYLPLKGYTYEQLFPTSLIWYGLAATMLGLWLAFFLSDRSLVRRPHAALLRHTVRSSALRGAVLGVARLLLRLGMPPHQLRLVTEHERDLAALELAAGERAAGKRLVATTRLLISIARLWPDRRLEALQAACDWQEAAMLLYVSQHPASTTLAPHIVDVCARTLRKDGLSLIDALADVPPALESTGCLIDVLRLALLMGAKLPGGEAEDPRAATLTSPAQLTQDLFWSTQRRLDQLDQLRSGLEYGISPERQRAVSRTLAAPFIQGAEPEELSLLGRLGLGSALVAAHIVKSEQLARGAIECVDALALTLACLDPAAWSDPASAAARARLWVGALPAPADRQLAVTIDAGRIDRLREAWSTVIAPGAALREVDLAAIEWQRATMKLASGPGREASLRARTQEEV